MPEDTHLPGDLQLCQQLIEQLRASFREQKAHCEQFEETCAAQQRHLQSLEQQLAESKLLVDSLLRKLYGRSSEKSKYAAFAGQGLLAFAADAAGLPVPAPAASPTDEQPARRQRRNRRADGKSRDESFPAHLERRDEIIDLPEDEKAGLTRIGEDVTERLEIDAPLLWVRRTIRPKYARPGDAAAGVFQRPTPLAPIEGGRYGFSFVSHVVYQKYALHIPLYREQDFLNQFGWAPSRSTLCQVVTLAAELLEPLARYMRACVLAGDLLGTDDTWVRLLTPGVGTGSAKARLWLYRGREAAPYNVFAFTKNWKAATGPDEFLANFAGTIVGDFYAGYGRIENQTGSRILHAACHLHARRDFFQYGAQDQVFASRVLAIYRLLYDVEMRATNWTAEARLELRRKESTKHFDDLLQLMDGAEAARILPRSKLGAAVGYVKNHREQLRRFLEDGRIPIDNNDTERDLRSVTTGRKNWLFVGSELAGARTANILTIVNSAHRHCLDVQAYLRDTLERLARRAQSPPASDDDLAELLPDRWKESHPQHVRDFRVAERERVATRKRIRVALRCGAAVPEGEPPDKAIPPPVSSA